ncbi:hypothetical protein CTEN210_07853 [Chaetoceros tenuissimus]|uniref:Nucleotide-diphospho-sugar transferase domain-containing protein n=1 Tax=Chaetoceros tenuissimus TaxID=426638 RepID=A0AAD3H5I2_9STRA|nr:hypothetical protein CTEN210_07853 [Chaetoceros tenuissimus]
MSNTTLFVKSMIPFALMINIGMILLFKEMLFPSIILGSEEEGNTITYDGISVSNHDNVKHTQLNNIISEQVPNLIDIAENAGNNEFNQVKFVAFTTIDYSESAKFWYNRMTELGYTDHRLVLADQAIVDYFSEVNKAGKEYYRFDVELVDPGKRRKNMVRSLWYHRILYCLNQLKKGYSILLSDSDNVFMRYVPLSNFQNDVFDAIFALELRFPTNLFASQEFVLCGGMTFLKATKPTIKIMELLLSKCDGGGRQRCDDQVEWNKLLAQEMTWDADAAKQNKTKDGLIQQGFTGVATNIEGFKAKVWDRDFAFRKEFLTETCPSEKNWVAMPLTLPHQTNKMFNGDINKEKLGRISIWDEFCGLNGTNRRAEGTLDDRFQEAVRLFVEEQK